MTPFETDALLASVAREVCHDEGVLWERDDDPRWTRLADRGDAIRRQIADRVEEEREDICPMCEHRAYVHTQSVDNGVYCQECSNGWCVDPF